MRGFSQLIKSVLDRPRSKPSPKAPDNEPQPSEAVRENPGDELSPPALPGNPDEAVLPPAKENELLQAIKSAFPQGRLGCDHWQPIVDAELRRRLFWFKHRYAPWINSIFPLKGARVLEIGAGTGCSSVPLLEAGACLTSIDISDIDLKIAELRADLHGVADRASFQCANAADIGRMFRASQFDIIVYFASLEHMTFSERIATLQDAWRLLSAGQLLVVCDSPNRLWYFDDHTALQNFFHWLPDDVAVAYAERTPRNFFNVDFKSSVQAAPTRLWRWGRGISYHEFEIAWGTSVKDLEVHGEWQHRRSQNAKWWSEIWMNSPDGRFHQFLRSIAPDIPSPFLEPELALMIRKL